MLYRHILHILTYLVGDYIAIWKDVLNTGFTSGCFWLGASLMCPLSTARWAWGQYKSRSDNCSLQITSLSARWKLSFDIPSTSVSAMASLHDMMRFRKADIPLSLCWSGVAMEMCGLLCLLLFQGTGWGDVGGLVFFNKFCSVVFRKPSLSDSRQSSYNTIFTKSFIICFRLHHSNCNIFSRVPAQNCFLVKDRDICGMRKPRRQPGGSHMCNAATESWGHWGLLQRTRGGRRMAWTRAGAPCTRTKCCSTHGRQNFQVHVRSFASERRGEKAKVWEERHEEWEDG